MLELKLKLKLIKINKKTQAKIFKDLDIGDEILLSTNLMNSPGNSKMLTVTNLKTGEKDDKYFTEIYKIFERLDFEEII